MLADLPQAQVRALYPSRSALVRRHGRRPRVAHTALRALPAHRVRQRGYAVEEDSVTPGLSSCSPCRSATARVTRLAAVAVTFESDEVDADARDRLAAAARTARRDDRPPPG